MKRSPSPQLWVVVGGNGAGKTTFYQDYLKPNGIPFINADNIARDLWSDDDDHSYQASQLAEGMRYRHLGEGSTFCFETVFSHPSKIDFLARAKAHGYQVVMVFIHLQNSDLNCARVAMRKELGGHDVPEEKIRGRIRRTMENVKTAVPLCDRVMMYDNSDNEHPYIPVLEFRDGVPIRHDARFKWTHYFLDWIPYTCF